MVVVVVVVDVVAVVVTRSRNLENIWSCLSPVGTPMLQHKGCMLPRTLGTSGMKGTLSACF